MPDKQKLERVRWLSQHGTAEQKRRAKFYLSVLRPATERKAAA